MNPLRRGIPWIANGKTESGNRTISLDPISGAYLRLHLAMLAKEKREFGDSYQDHVVDRAGMPLIRLHDVRHMYATLPVDAGVDPKILSDRIGHANMAYTMLIYTHRSMGKISRRPVRWPV